jgi:hypothetical protein
MDPLVGPNPAELSLNQPVYDDRLRVYIPHRYRGNGQNARRCDGGSHPGGRGFESP